MAQDRIVELKWSFAFWLGQLFAIVGFLSLLLPNGPPLTPHHRTEPYVTVAVALGSIRL